ncbi:hypothetical protein MMC11_001447 [Xylographa trunciseda]|nr:hypothetical protein [Xylographa trunciseda]
MRAIQLGSLEVLFSIFTLCRITAGSLPGNLPSGQPWMGGPQAPSTAAVWTDTGINPIETPAPSSSNQAPPLSTTSTTFNGIVPIIPLIPLIPPEIVPVPSPPAVPTLSFPMTGSSQRQTGSASSISTGWYRGGAPLSSFAPVQTRVCLTDVQSPPYAAQDTSKHILDSILQFCHSFLGTEVTSGDGIVNDYPIDNDNTLELSVTQITDPNSGCNGGATNQKLDYEKCKDIMELLATQCDRNTPTGKHGGTTASDCLNYNVNPKHIIFKKEVKPGPNGSSKAPSQSGISLNGTHPSQSTPSPKSAAISSKGDSKSNNQVPKITTRGPTSPSQGPGKPSSPSSKILTSKPGDHPSQPSPVSQSPGPQKPMALSTTLPQKPSRIHKRLISKPIVQAMIEQTDLPDTPMEVELYAWASCIDEPDCASGYVAISGPQLSPEAAARQLCNSPDLDLHTLNSSSLPPSLSFRLDDLGECTFQPDLTNEDDGFGRSQIDGQLGCAASRALPCHIPRKEKARTLLCPGGGEAWDDSWGTWEGSEAMIFKQISSCRF